MIRRRHGGQWLLITQDDHARLSGELARRIGAAHFAPLDARAVMGISLHDAGWPMHDDEPTLDSAGLPLNVFDTPRQIALPIWSASAERAAQVDAYAGLLVSLHSLCLSAMPEAAPSPTPARFESSQMKERFETNKFQHNQIELQENLRRQLEMRTDIPLTLGLATPGTDAREDQSLFDFSWLQAMDQLSLAICCSEVPFNHAMIHPRPGNRPVSLRFSRAQNDVFVRPWPFNAAELSCTILGRMMPDQKWDSREDFRGAYRAAEIEQIKIRLKAEG